MDGAPASDKSLLERLNALKPSPIRLTSSSSSKPNPASTIERSKSPSREDVLKARLQSLRNQGSESKDSTTIDQHHSAGQSTLPLPAQDNGPLTRESGIQPTPTPNQVTDDVDPLLYTDDQTLEELLEDLRADDFWLEEVAAEEEEHQRVTALLTELGNSSSVSAGPDRRNANQDGSRENSEDNSDGDGDSEEEIAAAEIDSVLAKAIDELEWENANKTSSPAPQPVPVSPTTGEQNSVDGGTQGTNDSPFNLPTVPSELQEPLDTAASPAPLQSDIDFAASIASRMAALKLSGPQELPSAPTAAVDALGLPQAPSFAPADRPVPGLAKRTGLTDEDQRTWCVVCLEDGTVHCLGCDAGDDVYCARCWKEMHVGPRAGYDERGHSWETLARRPR